MDEFIRRYNRIVRKHYNTGQRVGQAMFNALYELDPETADMIRGNYNLDPFYADYGRNFHRVEAFVTEVFGNRANEVRYI